MNLCENYYKFDNASNYANIYGPTLGYFMGNPGNQRFIGSNEQNLLKVMANEFSLDEHISVVNCVNKGILFDTGEQHEVHTLGYNEQILKKIKNFDEWDNKIMKQLGGDSQFIKLPKDGIKYDCKDSKIGLLNKQQGFKYSIIYNPDFLT